MKRTEKRNLLRNLTFHLTAQRIEGEKTLKRRQLHAYNSRISCVNALGPNGIRVISRVKVRAANKSRCREIVPVEVIPINYTNARLVSTKQP